MPQALASIGENGFAGAALASVVLPDGFEAMGEQAFMGCSSLTYANIGGAVEVPQRAFSKCVSLSTVNLRCDLNKLTKIGALAFSDEESSSSSSGGDYGYDAARPPIAIRIRRRTTARSRRSSFPIPSPRWGRMRSRT